MKQFTNKITLAKNSRGCYILDTIKGCSGCNELRPLGCYDNCYAQNIASRYRFDFQNPVKRNFVRDKSSPMLFDFYDEEHMGDIIRQIRSSSMPFVRIGEMGDPSEDWEHTLDICGAISIADKPIVIITKHWKTLTDSQLDNIRLLNLYVNTSISALDTDDEIEYRLSQYNRLKPYCNSILRVVSCDFNTSTQAGKKAALIQESLLANKRVIETVFRPNKENRLVKNNTINISKVRFLRSNVLASMRNDDLYLGMCDTCPDMCGLSVI